MENTVITHKCPSCSAPLLYNIEQAKWVCNFCGLVFDEADLLKIEPPIVTPEAGAATTPSWQAETFSDDDGITAYNCSNCGGRVIGDNNTVATFCAFCHSPAIIADRLKGDLKPDIIIPFKITKEKALEEFNKMLRLKPLLPAPFRHSIKKGEITGLYAPFWVFSSDVAFTMVAEGQTVTTWSSGDYRYTKHDIYHVERRGTVPAKQVPVDASSRLDNAMMDAIEPYNYTDLTDFNTLYLSGMFAESYDETREKSYNRFHNRTSSSVASIVRNTGKRYSTLAVKNFGVQTNNLVVKYAMFPVWTISIKYRNKIYSYAINGQTGKSSGKLPVSGGRAVAIFATIGAALSAISLLLYFL